MHFIHSCSPYYRTRLYARLSNAEQKAEESAKQVQQMLRREGELVGKTRVVERDLKRIAGERERMERERRRDARTKDDLRQKQQTQNIDPYRRGFETSDVDALVADIQRVKQRSRAISPVGRRVRQPTLEMSSASSSDEE